MRFGTLLYGFAAAPALVAAFNPNTMLRRQQDEDCKITLRPSNGGRKVAVVLDSSGSMLDNDPNNLRITAGKALNRQLLTSSTATGGKSADEVAVVDFDFSAAVIYPLGDPAGAESSYDSIDSVGGTFIADGVAKAFDELTKPGHGDTDDRSGIIVLTDGEDSDTEGLIDEINKAGSRGIRVSFGFLAPPQSFLEPTLLEAILKTGGTYMSFDQAENIEPWLFLLLGNGITNLDQPSSSTQPLLSGITIAELTGSGSSTFSYAAVAGEKLLFTVESLSQQKLDAELKHADGGSIGKNSTTDGALDPAELSFDADRAETLEITISSPGSVEGIFQISVNSSLGLSGCNLNQTTPPNPPNNGTYTPPNNGSTSTFSYRLPTLSTSLSTVTYQVPSASHSDCTCSENPGGTCSPTVPPATYTAPPVTYTVPPVTYTVPGPNGQPPVTYTAPPCPPGTYTVPPGPSGEPPATYTVHPGPPGTYIVPPGPNGEAPVTYTVPPTTYTVPPGPNEQPPVTYPVPTSTVYPHYPPPAGPSGTAPYPTPTAGAAKLVSAGIPAAMLGLVVLFL